MQINTKVTRDDYLAYKSNVRELEDGVYYLPSSDSQPAEIILLDWDSSMAIELRPGRKLPAE